MKKYYRTGIVTLAAVLLFSPVTAKASTFSGNNGALAYVQTAGGPQTIWKANPDGSSKTVLVENAVDPVWSPNGKKLAYIMKHLLGDRLYIMNADGTGRAMLTYAFGTFEKSPAWSPDGSQLTFVREVRWKGAIKASAIVTVGIASHSERNVTGWSTKARYAFPSWSPDAKELVYEKAMDDKRRLYIASLQTDKKRLLTTLSDDVDSHVSWSPSGQKILYNDSVNEIYTVWPDGTHRTVLSDGESFAASWSPDGTKIAFLEDKSKGEISISHPNGSITSLPVPKDSYRGIDEPVWSPDGSQLAFTLTYTDTSTHVADLYTIGFNGAPKVNIATGTISAMNWQALEGRS